MIAARELPESSKTACNPLYSLDSLQVFSLLRECSITAERVQWMVCAELKSSKSSENQLFSEAHLQSLGTEDLKTSPHALYLFFHLSLSFSLSLRKVF